MSRRPHDPGADPEDEGIPDLQDGTPEQQWSSDPQQESVPGDEPTAAMAHGTTANEAREGESLDERLAEEEPEPDPAVPPGPPEERAGLLYDEPDPDRAREQDVYSQEGTTHGLSAEEDAVRIRDEEDFADDQLAWRADRP